MIYQLYLVDSLKMKIIRCTYHPCGRLISRSVVAQLLWVLRGGWEACREGELSIELQRTAIRNVRNNAQN